MSLLEPIELFSYNNFSSFTLLTNADVKNLFLVEDLYHCRTEKKVHPASLYEQIFVR